VSNKGGVVSGFFAGWLTPFALACGVFALGLFAFLAATYMTIDTHDKPELQNDFRLRALWSGLALAPIAWVVFETSKKGAPEMYHGLTRWWEPVLLVWTSACAITALAALWWRRFAHGAGGGHRASHPHSGRLVLGPISKLDHPRCHRPQRRRAGTDLAVAHHSPGFWCAAVIAVPSLFISSF
jgi:hypothetical protein